MKKVYQTIHGRKDGNCLPAVIASLLELDIDDVPHFNKTPNWYESLSDFVFSKEHQIVSCFYNTEEAKLRGWGSYPAWYEKNKSLKNGLEMVNDYEGVDGLFYAAVYSPNNYDSNDKHPALHAVIIDKNFNIIHDPEESYRDIKEYPRAKELGYNGVVDVTIIQKINNGK